MRALHIAAFGAALALAGCAGMTPAETAQTIQATAQADVAAYSALPPCSATVTSGCSRPDVAAKLEQALASVNASYAAYTSASAADQPAAMAALVSANTALLAALPLIAR